MPQIEVMPSKDDPQEDIFSLRPAFKVPKEPSSSYLRSIKILREADRDPGRTDQRYDELYDRRLWWMHTTPVGWFLLR